MNIQEIKQKYPQYAEMPDDVLAEKLHAKFYADKISLDEFKVKVGLVTAQPEPAPVEQVTQTEQSGPASLGETLTGAYETAKTIGGGVAGSIYGGYAGLFELIKGEGVDKAVEVLRQKQEALSYQPETQEGKNQLELITRSLETLGDAGNFAASGVAGLANLALNPSEGLEGAQNDVDAVRQQGLGKALGNETLEITGRPELATVAELSPELVGIFTGKMALKPDTPVKSKLLQKIEASPNDPALAKYMIAADKVTKDKNAVNSIKQGFDDGVVATVKNSSRADKDAMLKMLRKLENGKKDALYAAKNRPADVAGESLLSRVNFVKKLNRKAGSELEATAKSLKGQSVDFDGAINNFKQNLSEMGVTLDDKLKPVFKGSDIEGVKGAESAIKKIMQRLRTQEDIDAYGVHRVKKFIDEQVSYGKSIKGLSGKSERILKSLRADLDNALDSQFPKYDKVNRAYSDTITAIDSLQSSAGKKLDLFGDNADKSTGTLLRRLMSNAQGRVTLMDSIDSLESVAKKYGAKLDDDITTQVLFADELDRLFGAPAKTSLRGETAKSVKEVADGEVGLVRMGVNKAGELAEKARGINEQNAIKAMRELLKK